MITPPYLSLGRLALACVLVAGLAGTVLAQEGAGAWRVECGGDGKTLECRAVQQLLTREDKRLVVQLLAYTPAPEASKPADGKPADGKAPVAAAAGGPVLQMQLPLGISVSDPVVFKIDNGNEERLPIQTCTNSGCFLTVPLKEPLLGALRTGTALKLALQDTSKRTIAIDVPLLGFSLAFDKATK
jgi:invasion protein IalB